MGYMEISLLSQSAVKIKGKSATFVVNPQTATPANAVLSLVPGADMKVESEESILLNGSGEYEIAGVKITGLRNEKSVLYTMHLDSLDVIVGPIALLAAMQNKLKEHNVVIVSCDEVADAAFLTTLAINAVLFYGEKAQEVAQAFEKEKLKQMNKYATSLSKLPTEMETVLLA